MASASSTRHSASALRDGGPEITAGSSVPFIASVILLALIASTILFALNVAAGGSSAVRLAASYHQKALIGSDTVSAMRLPVKGFSGWSRPMLPDHADLAATEQAQREAARARRGGKLIRRALSAHFDPRTHRRRGSPACRLPSWVSYQDLFIPIQPRRSIVNLLLQPTNDSSAVRLAASYQQKALIFSLSRNTTGFDQDDAAGLAAERAFDDHLLEKRMLLDAAACAPTSTRPVLFACECCCVESALDCLCGAGACTSCVAVLHSQPLCAPSLHSTDQDSHYLSEDKAWEIVEVYNISAARRAKHDTVIKVLVQKFSEALHEKLKERVQAVARTQVIIKHGTGAYAIHSLEELSALKQEALHNASRATGLSNLRMHLILNGKPVYDEGAIFDIPGTLSSCEAYTLQVAQVGGSGNGEEKDHKAEKARQAKARRVALLWKESEAEKRIRLDKTNMKNKERREKEDQTARQARQAADKARHAKARADEDEEVTKARRAADRASHAKARASETNEAHARRLEQQKPRDAAAAANKRANRPKDVDEEWFHTYTRTEALKSDAAFWANYKTDPLKNLMLFLWNSGHAYLPNYNRIRHGDPSMSAAAWDDATAVDPLLLDLRSALEGEVIDDALKLKRLAEYNKRVNLEAELPSCACCGLRTYPVNGGVEHPLTEPAPAKQSEAARAKQSFVVLPIGDSRFERLKVTEEQLAEHGATRQYRTVFRHGGADYHLYPQLILPAAPGSAPGPDQEPHVVVCSACFSRLPRPKSRPSPAVAGKKRSFADFAAGESDSGSDQVNEAAPSGDDDAAGPPASKPQPLPYNSVAAGYEYGQLHQLPKLSLIESAIIAKVIPYGTIIKVKEFQGVSQRAITGQTICFPTDGPEAAASFAANHSKTTFPFHSNATLADHFKVSFVGPEGQANDYIKILMMPDGPLFFDVDKILTWLRVLRQTHPFYADLELPSSEELASYLAPLHQLIRDQAQVVDDDTARFMEQAKIGTDIAGVRDVLVGQETAGGDVRPQHRDGHAADETAGASSREEAGEAALPQRLPLILNDVVIIDAAERDDDPDQRLLDALNATMRKPVDADGTEAQDDSGALFCRRSDEPVNEFSNNSDLLVCAFPHLFPFGVGIPSSALSQGFTRYLMFHHSNAFSNEPRLYFLLFNQLQRHINCRSTSTNGLHLRVKAQKKHVDAVTRITTHESFMPRLEAATANPDSLDAKRLLASLHPHIVTLGAKAPFSPSARSSSFNHLVAGLNRSSCCIQQFESNLLRL